MTKIAAARPNFSLTEIPVPMVYATHRIIRDCNEEFLQLFSYSKGELIDRSFAVLYPKKADFVRTGRMWKDNLSGGRAYYDERIMVTGDGRHFWCQVNGRAWSTSDPFAQTLYCFQPIPRPVAKERLHLTDRQRQIVTLVSQGKTNSTIASELGLSRRTVESHRARLMQATGISNAAELIARFTKS